MYSYIFNSRRYPSIKPIVFVLAFIFFNTSIDALLQYYIDLQTTKDYFFENKRSKMKHYLLHNNHSKDYVFIGTSRTLYHISSNVFHKNS